MKLKYLSYLGISLISLCIVIYLVLFVAQGINYGSFYPVLLIGILVGYLGVPVLLLSLFMWSLEKSRKIKIIVWSFFGLLLLLFVPLPNVCPKMTSDVLICDITYYPYSPLYWKLVFTELSSPDKTTWNNIGLYFLSEGVGDVVKELQATRKVNKEVKKDNSYTPQISNLRQYFPEDDVPYKFRARFNSLIETQPERIYEVTLTEMKVSADPNGLNIILHVPNEAGSIDLKSPPGVINIKYDSLNDIFVVAGKVIQPVYD